MGHNVGCEETIHGDILVRGISRWTEKWSEMCGFIGEVWRTIATDARREDRARKGHQESWNQSHDQFPFRLCLAARNTDCQKVFFKLCKVKIERSCFKQDLPRFESCDATRQIQIDWEQKTQSSWSWKLTHGDSTCENYQADHKRHSRISIETIWVLRYSFPNNESSNNHSKVCHKKKISSAVLHPRKFAHCWRHHLLDEPKPRLVQYFVGE